MTPTLLAVDTETNSLRAHEPGVGFMLQWADEGGEVAATGPGAGVAFAAGSLGAELVMANAPFDTHVIRSTWGIDLLRGWDPVERCIFGIPMRSTSRLIRDVQTLARVTVPGRFDYRLEYLGNAFLGTDSTEQQRALKERAKSVGIGTLRQAGAHRAVWDAYPKQLEDYGKEDVRITYDLYQLLLKRASPSDLRVFDLECEVQRVLMTAEQHGVLVDKAELALLRTRLESELADARAKLLEWLPPEALGSDDDPANQTALREGLIAAGVPLYKHTPSSGKLNEKTGKRNPVQLATNKDALGEFEDSNEAIGLLFTWRRLGKTLSTYVAALERANPRVHANFLSCEARTSRMSCRSPNMQNLPRGSGARNTIIPADGNALVVVDYDSIEVWVLGHYLSRACGNRELLDLLESGIDMHTATAAKVFGAKPQSKGGPPRHLRGRDFRDPELLAWYTKGGPGDAQRTLAKTTTFSSLYGIGYRKLSRRLGVSEEVGKEIKGAVLNAIPGYWDLYDKLQAHMKRVGFLRTALWRRLDVPKGKPHINLNTVVQGTAAEIMKLGMLAAEAPLAALGYQIIMVVHDELVSEGSAENAEAATAACIAAMESVHALVDHNGDPLFDCSLKATGSHTTLNYGACK